MNQRLADDSPALHATEWGANYNRVLLKEPRNSHPGSATLDLPPWI